MKVVNPNGIIVIGGGGHAKVVINLLLESGQFQIEGILDERLKRNSHVLGVPALGGDQEISRFAPDQIRLALGVGTMRASSLRKELYDRFVHLGYVFPTLVHPKTCIGRNVFLEDGVQVMAHVVIQPEAKIGFNSILNTGAVIEHDVLIAPHVHVAPGAVIGGGVSIGEGSLIGLGARLLPGVKIGRGVTVGAGAAVIHDIQDGQTAVGVPAKNIHV